MKKTLKQRLQELAGIEKEKSIKEYKQFQSSYIQLSEQAYNRMQLNEQDGTQDWWPDEINPDLMGVIPLIFWSPDGTTANSVIEGPCGTENGYYAGETNGSFMWQYPVGFNGAETAEWGIANFILSNNIPIETPFSSIYWDAPINTNVFQADLFGSGDDLDADYISPCINPDISGIYPLGPQANPDAYGGFGGYEYRISGFNLSLPTYTIVDNQIVMDTGAGGFDLGLVYSLMDILQKVVDHCLYTMTNSDEFPDINSWDDCNEIGLTTPYTLMNTYGLGFGSTWHDWYTFLGTSVSYNCPATGGIGSCGVEYCQCECLEPEGCTPPGPVGCDDPNATNYYCTLPGQSECEADISTQPWTWTLPANFTPCESCCTYESDGCTDETADNYNPNAIIDDGSCVWSIVCHKCQYPDGIYDYGVSGELTSAQFNVDVNPDTVDEDPCQEGWFIVEPDCSGDPFNPVGPVEEEKRHECKAVTSNLDGTQNFECVADPNGAFESLEACQDAKCGGGGEKKKQCYTCKNGSPVGFMYPDPPGCPKGWQDEVLTLDDCRSSCDDPLVDEWLNHPAVESAHCCEVIWMGVTPSPNCQNIWEQLGGSANQNILECCPGPSTDGSGTPGADPDGIPPIPNTTIQRLRELAGLKNKN